MRRLTPLAGAVVLALVAASFLALALRHRAKRPGGEEQAAFVALKAACRTEDARAIYRAFAAWRPLLPSAAQAEATPLIRPVEQQLFAPGQTSGPMPRFDLAAAARLRHAAGGISSVDAGALPPLNASPANVGRQG